MFAFPSNPGTPFFQAAVCLVTALVARVSVYQGKQSLSYFQSNATYHGKIIKLKGTDQFQLEFEEIWSFCIHSVLHSSHTHTSTIDRHFKYSRSESFKCDQEPSNVRLDIVFNSSFEHPGLDCLSPLSLMMPSIERGSSMTEASASRILSSDSLLDWQNHSKASFSLSEVYV